jgi:hypothetical protein
LTGANSTILQYQFEFTHVFNIHPITGITLQSDLSEYMHNIGQRKQKLNPIIATRNRWSRQVVSSACITNHMGRNQSGFVYPTSPILDFTGIMSARQIDSIRYPNKTPT